MAGHAGLVYWDGRGQGVTCAGATDGSGYGKGDGWGGRASRAADEPFSVFEPAGGDGEDCGGGGGGVYGGGLGR